jgi:hypothetical protein
MLSPLFLLLLGQSDVAGTAPRLGLPIACELGRTCEIQNYVDRDPGPGARDYHCGARTYEGHSGIDFRLLDLRAQRAGVAVLAAAPGRILRARDGVPDVSVRDRGGAAVAGQECGNGLVIQHAGGLTTQYCHMAKDSLTVRPGMEVQAGTPLGRVGLSGNTEYPHLHFTVRRDNVVIDPFAPSPGAANRCAEKDGLWRAELAKSLVYKAGVVLNAGFAAGPVDMAGIEAGIAAPTDKAPTLVAYVRAIGLAAGDRQNLTLRGPDGQVLAQSSPEALTADQAQRTLYIGRNRPGVQWPKGRYEARYQVVRNGRVAIERRWELIL